METLHLVVQLPEASGDGSLTKEMGDALQRLLQHLTLAVLLWLRFCMLPMTYAYYILSTPQSPWTRNIWSNIIRLGQCLAKRIPHSVKEHYLVVQWTPQLRKASSALFKMCRIAHALYNLGELLDQNPDLLKSRRSSSVQQPTTAEGSDCVGGTGGEAARHATASQVYHAALAKDRNTLDDLLAGFSVSGDASQSGQSHCRQSSVSSTECQRCSQRGCYRNSSIQTTPEQMFTPLQAADPLSSAGESGVSRLPNSAEDTPTAPGLGLPTSLSPIYLPPGAEQVPRPADEGSVLAGPQSLSQRPEGCPREVARQAQSRIPRRRSSPPDIGLDSDVSIGKRQSMPNMEPATPSRRGKLQRRVRTPRT